MNALDLLVLIGTIVGIAVFGMWRTRGKRDLSQYLKGNQTTGWIVVGVSVMATQASAITFISATGQGYQDGLGFVQNYFGLPLAMIVIAAVFVPIYRRLNVYTAYEYLGQRFDAKTRLLGAGLFLLQRGFAAGVTIYAPAIVLSSILGWRLDLTIIVSGVVATVYTAAGGSEAVNVTQKYQMTVIMGGMVAAFVVLLTKLPEAFSFTDALTVAGGFHKLETVDYTISVERRYTFWSGLLGGFFLALSYFGTDQSQVQRYLSGASLRESRLGLMFNAVCKIPMQFFILLVGAMVFVFYQFVVPPLFFNETVWQAELQGKAGEELRSLERDFASNHSEKQRSIVRWLDAKHAGDADAEARARAEAVAANERSDAIRASAKKALPKANANDTDYVFMTFVLQQLPHGLIGLLIAAIFAAALQSKAAELNALASTTVVDFYRHIVRRDESDSHYVIASKVFTVMWGAVAVGFALFANLQENLIQAANIVASIFYGVVLGLFVVGFFFRWVGSTAVFWSALAAQTLVLVMYSFLTREISYLWYNLIGCGACVLFSLMIHTAGRFFALGRAPGPAPLPDDNDTFTHMPFRKGK
jgi:SSS family solute:Na+ symporter